LPRTRSEPKGRDVSPAAGHPGPSANVVGRHVYPSQGLDDGEGRPENLSRTFRLVPQRVERSCMRLSWQSAASWTGAPPRSTVHCCYWGVDRPLEANGLSERWYRIDGNEW